METLALERIKQDLSIQQRVGGLQSARVREYSTAMKNGDVFPPVVVYHGEKKDEQRLPLMFKMVQNERLYYTQQGPI